MSGIKKASFANYMSFVDYIYDENKKIVGVKAFDKINSKEIIVKAEVIVNATGIWGDSILSQNDKFKDKLIKAARGM